MNCSEHLINKNILNISDLVLEKMRSEKKFGSLAGSHGGAKNVCENSIDNSIIYLKSLTSLYPYTIITSHFFWLLGRSGVAGAVYLIFK